MNAVITAVRPKSPATKARIKKGDKLKSINGNTIFDVLDYKFYEADSILEIALESAKGKTRVVTVFKSEDEDLGLTFDTYLMDRPHACSNKCVFCFVDQLPRGMRNTLYFKDDDARLSFLTGNYVTLTNLDEREAARICSQRISPLNISVHTTNPELRAKMLGNVRGAEIMGLMRRFADCGITMDCQIVCCPELNDGSELMRTMRDLSELYPAVRSVSVVPVGLTRFRDSLMSLKLVDKAAASDIIDMVDRFGNLCLESRGSRVFFCADELYIKAGYQIPDGEYYEEYTQFENGVGMLRLLHTEFISELENLEVASIEPFSIASGMAAAPFIEKLLYSARKRSDRINGTVFAVENEFFGYNVDVAGLITGRDLISQLEGKDLGKRLLIPATMLRHGGDVFLDDVTPEQVSGALGIPVEPIPQDGAALARAVFGLDFNR